MRGIRGTGSNSQVTAATASAARGAHPIGFGFAALAVRCTTELTLLRRIVAMITRWRGTFFGGGFLFVLACTCVVAQLAFAIAVLSWFPLSCSGNDVGLDLAAGTEALVR